MPKSVLVADDSLTIRKIIGMLLATEDITLTAVDNGLDAISRTRELKPDLVLADCMMPGKSGYEVCEAIKSDPSMANTPVLLLAGNFEPFDQSRAQLARADGHIVKPFDSTSFVDKVKGVVGLTGPSGGLSTSPSVAPSASALPPAAPQAFAAMPPGRTGSFPAMQPPTSTGSFPAMARPGTSAFPAFRPLPPQGAPPPAAASGPMRGPPARIPVATQSGVPRPPGPGLPGSAPSQSMTRPTTPALAPLPPAPGPSLSRPAPGPGPGPAMPQRSAPGQMPMPMGMPRPAPMQGPPPQSMGRPGMGPHGMQGMPPQGMQGMPMPPGGFPRPPPAGVPMPPGAMPPRRDPYGLGAPGAPRPPAGALQQPQQLHESLSLDDGGEGHLREALSKASREVIEKIAWEVVPHLAEAIIREELDRLIKDREAKGLA